MRLWTDGAQYITEALAIILIFRLLWLHEHGSRVYSVFVAFLSVELFGSLAYFAARHWLQIDYRLIYLIFTVLLSVLSLWLVYSLSKSVLAELPGILRFSRFLLNTVFLLAILLAFSTSRTEYILTSAKTFQERLDKLLYALVVADKGIAMASIVILIIILAFILWFPVKMSRNLAVFSVGLVVYFTCKTGLELIRIYARPSAATDPLLDVGFSVVVIGCFLYWIAFLNSKGKITEVRIGHGWQRDEQEKLIAQLESLNGALVRSSEQLRKSEKHFR